MEWYYADNGTQQGPVPDAEFHRLVSVGRIQSTTLVWKQGMADWQPYSSVAAPSAPTMAPQGGHEVCAECRGQFLREDMVQFKTSWICAACKPVFFQRLKEGGLVGSEMEFAGFGPRFAAKLIDGLLLFVVNLLTNLLVDFVMVGSLTPRGKAGMAILAVKGVEFLFNTAVGVAYYTWFVGKFSATPGKMALKLQVVRSDGSRLTYGRALGRYFGEMVSGFTLGIGYLMVIWDGQKRALHDHICDTRVIRTS